MISFWKLRQSPNFRFAILTMPGALFLLTFLVLPLISILIYSFWRTESYQLIADWNIENYKTILTQKTYLTFIWRSLVMAVSVSLACLVFSDPGAYLVAKNGGGVCVIFGLFSAAALFSGFFLWGGPTLQNFWPLLLFLMCLSHLLV